ncbi:MAG: hypothetical protein HZB66_02180, partial [Candidatus Aenigmarchaeota archaeon]|nr:hypothetical protein [Candidatus Aenigmarchaeota archaeon]
MTEIKRLTAIKTSIKPLINGRFVKQEGFDPSFVISPSGQRLSRVRILATVVNKYEPEGGKFSSVTIDDGTATIRAKIFGSSLFSGIKEADLVDVIGKIREYNGEIYVLSESVVKLDDPNWEILRELELRKQAEKWNMIKSRIFDLQKEASDILELKKLAQAEGMDPEDIEPVLLSQDIAEVQ